METQENINQEPNIEADSTVQADLDIQAEPDIQNGLPKEESPNAEIKPDFNFEEFFQTNQDKFKSMLETLFTASSESEDKSNDIETDSKINTLEAKAKDLEEKERLLNNRQLEYETIKLLAEKNIPITAIKLIIGSDIEETAQKIELFEKEIDKVAQIIVNNRLRSKAPSISGDRRGYSYPDAKANQFTVYEWYKDTISGKVKTDNRPNYQYMKNKLKQGDTLIVSDLDKLGRDASNTIIEIKELQAKGIKLIALDIPYMNDFGRMNNDSMSRMIIDIVVTLKAHMAEQEREKTISRINQGLAVAKENGVKLGRPTVNLPTDFIRQYEKFLNGEYGKISNAGFAKMLGIGRSTLYKYISIYKGEYKQTT